ncbi:hypothetical protein DFH08DRAFT_824254 [Mycena albidolilacea]|uniref:Uncharacterized protein n=1 Tax=Mycena albidolilacea TaxID=1033008 RepID=A0AAD6Z546_9AGAR|nr:hypothetical protein DFH08DRAFT_824254 [Mycena albidolilacea]
MPWSYAGEVVSYFAFPATIAHELGRRKVNRNTAAVNRMVNSHGHNGHENGTPPENLREILQQFATDSKLLQEHWDILRMQHNYSIGKTTLKNLNCKHRIVSARWPPPEHVCTTLIAKQMAENVTGTNGPNTIQKRIALQDGVPIARQVYWSLHPSISVFTVFRAIVRGTMHALDPGGPARRFPSKRPPKVRSTLTDSAVYYEVHLDGHEKLNFKALRMGRASIDMYGGRCHGSWYIVHLTAVPNASAFSKPVLPEIPIQITVDGGTEPQYMFQFHEQLRAQFLPEISSTDAPACVALKSSDNIPIKALWSYFVKYTGHDLKAAILLGKTENYINVANELHIDLFHWLWSRIVQNAVNQFV